MSDVIRDYGTGTHLKCRACGRRISVEGHRKLYVRHDKFYLTLECTAAPCKKVFTYEENELEIHGKDVKEMGLDELRRKSLELGLTRIQGDGGPIVPLATWQGVLTLAEGGPGDVNMVNVRYYLEGRRLRVHRDLNGDVWYTLS